MSTKGLTIIYYGKGKGKTTAAMGLAVRALGTGLNVAILQFIKGEWPSGERDFFQVLKDIEIPAGTLGKLKVKTLGRGFVRIIDDKKPFVVHKRAARDGIEEAKKILKSKEFDVVILDEIISAFEEKVITISDIEKVLKAKPKNVHLVLTGHTLPARLKTKADLVTEMKMIKHPYYKGMLAERGVDY